MVKNILLVFCAITCIILIACSNGEVVQETLEENCPPQSSKILEVKFLQSVNELQLIEDVKCDIIGDSVIECWIRNMTSNKILSPHIKYQGRNILIDGLNYDIEQKYDFSKPVNITVESDDNNRKEYIVYVHSFTGLPVMWIDTNNREEITSKLEYVKAHMRFVEDVITRGSGESYEAELQIKGRGNSTWHNYPKKPYRLKFDENISFFRNAKDKAWVLLANYLDKSMLCNHTAFYLSSLSCLEFTPNAHFVELMLNGQYWGTYELVEKIKVAEHRVNVGKDGFLLEIDGYAPQEDDTHYFTPAHLNQAINIKEPKVEYGDVNFNYIMDYVNRADSILYCDNFKDVNEGWQKYLDINTFVDWYLINEISKNTDSFWWNGYMSLKRGDKLKMGPIWDYDNAFGIVGSGDKVNPEGFLVLNQTWYTRLFQDSVFVSKVKLRFNYFYNKKSDILQYINENAQYLKYSIEENDKKWNTLYNQHYGNFKVWGRYENEVFYIKNWLEKRFEWLKNEYNKM